MNKYIAILLRTASILPFGTPAYADFQKGLDAAKSGDFATALREWKPLAEQGNLTAQTNLGNMYTDGRAARKPFKQVILVQ